MQVRDYWRPWTSYDANGMPIMVLTTSQWQGSIARSLEQYAVRLDRLFTP